MIARTRVALPITIAAAAVPRTAAELAEEISWVLGRMSYEERIRAYCNHVFAPRELAIAAARLP